MLKGIPTENHLSRMYYELAKIGASSAGSKKTWPYKIGSKEELIALAADTSRFDPRLFDIMVNYFIQKWIEINPARLRGYYKVMKCPQTIAVIAEFLKEADKSEDVKYFVQYVQAGLKPVSIQFYFYNLYVPGGKIAGRAVEEGLYEYKRWGFLAAERPRMDADRSRFVGTLDTSARKNILSRLLQEGNEITIKKYLDAVQNSISRQQALLDLKAGGLAVSIGKGRGAKWKKAA